jgi:hypothetical protein
MKARNKNTSFEKMSKKAQKEELKRHRKPPIPAPKITPTKAEYQAKAERRAKHRGYQDE